MMSSLERLAYMANQIARNFEAQGHDAAVRATADHIASFWDPRMRAEAQALLARGEGALSPTAAEAFALLRDRAAQAGAR